MKTIFDYNISETEMREIFGSDVNRGDYLETINASRWGSDYALRDIVYLLVRRGDDVSARNIASQIDDCDIYEATIRTAYHV